MRKIGLCMFLVICFTLAGVSQGAFAGSAMDDLNDMSNTGTTFDGSDGQRSGMDIDFYDTDAPYVPEPTPEPVDSDN